MVTDVHAWTGRYPFRNVGAGPADLLEAMDQRGIATAWVSHLSAVFWRDPTAGNRQLYGMFDREARFRPVPAVHPGLPNWTTILAEARDNNAAAVRADPTFYGIAPNGPLMIGLAREAAAAGLPLMLTVKLEDGRQRHPNDGSSQLEPWAVRSLIRSDPDLRMIVTAADREFIEQVHFGSTPAEADRILWDVSWIWGPPEDHLGLLLDTVGPTRFCFGSGMPLRIGDNTVAKLDLTEMASNVRAAIESGNLQRFAGT